MGSSNNSMCPVNLFSKYTCFSKFHSFYSVVTNYNVHVHGDEKHYLIAEGGIIEMKQDIVTTWIVRVLP